MTLDSLNLPVPDPDAARLSAELSALIAEDIAARGPMGFDRFMQHALYEPGLGYYSAGLAKFGEAGDFITAPELGPVFARCLARQVAQVLTHLEMTQQDGEDEGCTILEIGAGSGVMANDLLTALAARDQLPEQYLILETSAELRDRQRQRLAHWQGLEIRWIDSPPCKRFRGVILGNEVLDALPVQCFEITEQGVQERRVTYTESGFGWLNVAADEDLTQAVEERVAFAGQAIGYRSEYCPMLRGWIEAMASSLSEGVLLLVDYGYPRGEYYHPERNTGSLICHYRHRAHDNPFVHVGLTDISAFVDFTAVALAAEDAGMSMLGYNTQADFLLGCGLGEELQALEELPDRERLAAMTAVKRLTLPSEMGEKFKVMALGKGAHIEQLNELGLLGFSFADRSGRL